MSAKLKKTIKEKIQDIKDQRDVIVAFLNEFVSEAESKADELLATKDAGHFNNYYIEVMQHLDRCYNTFVLLSAEAEEKINGGSISKGDDDSFSEGAEDTVMGATAGANSIGDLCSSSTDIRHDSTKDNPSLSNSRASNFPRTTVDPFDDRASDHCQSAKPDSFNVAATVVNVNTLDCENRNSDIKLCTNADSKCNIVQSSGMVCDDVNLNKQTNKPTAVKGVLGVLRPVQGEVDEENHKEESAQETQSDEQQKKQVHENVVKKDQENTEIIHNIHPEQESCILELIKVEEIQPAEGKLKDEEKDHSKKSSKKEAGIQLSPATCILKEPSTQSLEDNSLSLSKDSHSYVGFGNSCQPKLDIDVAKRFLRGVIQQANEDNMKLNNEKQERKKNAKGREKDLVTEKLQKSRNTSRDDSGIVTETKPTDSKTGTQNNEEKQIQNEADTCESEAVPYEHKERGDKSETEVIDTTKETKELVVNSECKGHVSSKYVKDVVVENNLNQQDGKALSETNDETVQNDQLLVNQETERSQVRKGAVTDSDDCVKCVEVKTGTDSKEQQPFCVVKDSVETSDLTETATERSSSKNTDNLGGLKNDDQTSNIAEKDDYGMGPGLHCEVLENSKIHSVIVSEANSPWMFYVQKFTTDLEEMMNDLRTVTDLEPIISPTEGMLCLAQFSKDGSFYRAKVVELCSKGKDTLVEVLFLDYGNGESRKPSHLRKLPWKYASLPAQGILCALSQVAPNNKYGIWTEDQITLFTQIVSGRHFNCMPYHVSSKPDLPSIVGLFFNIPEQVIKDGNIIMQPGPKQISIHEYLIEKGLAKSVTVEEQLQLLHTLQYQKEPADQVDKSPALADQALADQGDKKTRNVDRKGSIQSQSTVNLGSSMETLSDSLHSLPRLPKSTTREERERKALEEKDKREAKQREKSGRPTKHSKTEARSVKDSLKSKGVKTKSAKDSPRSKVKKCDDKVQTEDDTDSAQPVCSTPVEGHGIHNNLNIEKSLDTVSEQGVENHNCVQNITEIKIKNVAEDLVSVRSSDTESLHYAEDRSVSLPTNIDVDIPGLKVMLSHVESPSDFYVHLVSEVSAKTIDHMHISLNKTMEETSKKQLQKMSKSYKPSVGDLCCVLFSYDNQYYRGLVMGLELASPTKGSGSKDSSSENVGKVSVFYLDFGNHEVVPKRRVFPLPPQYADLPGLALHVCLAYIQPSVTRGSPKKEVKWTDEATKKFISVTGFDSALSMIIVDGDIKMMLEKHPNEVVKMDPLQVLLVDNTKEEEDVCVNMDLIRLGLARLCASENSSKEPPNSLQQTVTSPDQMKDWNPMMEDYMDARNSYKVDVDDAGVATVGYKGQDDQKICRFYQKNRCWSGDRCPYRHIIVPEDALTADVDYVYGDVMEEYYQDGLPDPGTWIACEVSTIINPAHFYIVLPFGKEPLASLEPAKKEDGYGSFQQETLEDLMASLQDFYGGKQFEGSYVDYAPGEMVVARYSVDLQWYRARVISSGDRKVEVFYVDFGNKEFLSDISIRNIDPQFLHLPFQALECFLVDIEPVGGRDSFSQEARLQFRKLVDGKTLVAYIKSRSWSGCAWVELFDTSGEDDISIAGSLIERGLAQESTVLSSTTSGRGSNTSSRVSSQESLVLIPG